MLTNRNCKLGRPVKPISVNKRWYSVRVLVSGKELWSRYYGYKLEIYRNVCLMFPQSDDIEIYVLSPIKK